ncbi:MAG: glutamate 5-kinase [Gammaproteobacteria bacterium]|nr:glutamate 5-kinase [Gammaproteobacteria bacterium]
MSKNNSPRRRWVVKIGSSLLTNHGKGLARERIQAWADQIQMLRSKGVDVVVVSSGSIAEGMVRLGWSERPHEVYRLQAAAAVGQMGLVQAYEQAFQAHGVHTAQVLLTHDDLSNRQRYLNARSTLRGLLELGVIPIVNENDTVVTDEIRFGDNDTLGALVANLVEAEYLVILTDTDGLFTADPGQDKNAALVEEGQAGDASLLAMASKGTAGKLGRGGMATKVMAATRAARSGATTVIAGGLRENILLDVEQRKAGSGTWLLPDIERFDARKQWLAGHLQAKGKLTLDEGAVRVLKSEGKSLLSVGVRQVEGQFGRGEVVVCVDAVGEPVAKGLINYNAEETRKIIGKPSKEIESILGYVDEPELIHRDNLVLVS